MSLFQQIQVFLSSIVIAMAFCALYGAFNRMFYRWHGKIKRWVFELLLFLLFAYLYFRVLVLICQAQLNIHYLLALAIGVFLYQRFYAFYVNLYYEKIAILIKKHVFSPLRKQMQKIHVIIKKRREKRKHGKRKEKKPQN